MSKRQKILRRLMSGQVDTNLAFDELCSLLQHLGFTLRIRGDHHIFFRADIAEIINLQPVGSLAKPYQVKQVRNLLRQYRLHEE